MARDIEQTFCYKYLSVFSSIKYDSIKSMVENDFDCEQALLCMDTYKDLPLLIDISLGQRAILRKVLNDFQQKNRHKRIDLFDGHYDYLKQKFIDSDKAIECAVKTEIETSMKCLSIQLNRLPVEWDQNQSNAKQVTEKCLTNVDMNLRKRKPVSNYRVMANGVLPVRSVPNSGYKCNWKQCSRTFNRPDSLRDHLIMHKGVKNFKCPKCNVAFMLKRYMQKHLRKSHTDYYNKYYATK